MGKLVGMGIGAAVGLALTAASGGAWWALMPLVGIALGHFYDAQTGFTDADVAAAMLHGHAVRPEPARPRVEPEPDHEPEPRREPEPEPPPAMDDEAAAYARLGLTSAATDAELKAAYRQLAQKLHPDKVH